MDAKHTPGPWKWVATFGGWDGVADDSGATICKLVLNNPENARLIAAAPELLDALKGLVRYAEAVRVSAGMGPSQLKRFEAAKEAIAKAEGKEQG